MNDQSIVFEGPFRCMPGNGSVFDQETARSPGVYLWALEKNGRYLVNYVGITSRSISDRLQDHLVHYYCGDYTIYDPEDFATGTKREIYKPNGSVLQYAPRFMELASNIDALVKTYSLFIAKVNGDKEWLERIESGLINQLREAGGKAADFLDNYRTSRNISEDKKQIVTIVCQAELEGISTAIRV